MTDLKILVSCPNTTIYESTTTAWKELATGILQLSTNNNNKQFSLRLLCNKTKSIEWQFYIILPFHITQDSSSELFFYFPVNYQIFFKTCVNSF